MTVDEVLGISEVLEAETSGASQFETVALADHMQLLRRKIRSRACLSSRTCLSIPHTASPSRKL